MTDASLLGGTADSTGFELRMAVFRLARRLRAERADGGLGDTQVSVLSALRYEGPLTAGQLAERGRVTPASMHATVNGLDAAGLVTRSPSEDDARKVIVTISAEGIAVLDRTVQLRDAWIAGALARLGDDDVNALADAIPAMRRLADL